PLGERPRPLPVRRGAWTLDRRDTFGGRPLVPVVAHPARILSDPSANDLRSHMFRTPLSHVEAASLPVFPRGIRGSTGARRGIDVCPAAGRAAGTRRRSSRFRALFAGCGAAKSTRFSLTSVRTRTRSASRNETEAAVAQKSRDLRELDGPTWKLPYG